MHLTRRFLCLIALTAAAAGVAAPAGAAPGDPSGPRLEGSYAIDYQRKTFDDQTWDITPTCGTGACDSRLKGTDVSGTLNYRSGPKDYVIHNSYKGGVCSRKNPDTGKREVILEDSLVYHEKITVGTFLAGDDVVTSAKGVINAVAKPTAKAKRLGCTNSLTLRTAFTVKLR